MAKKQTKLHPDIEATFKPGPKANKAVASLSDECKRLGAASSLSQADEKFLNDVRVHVPPLQPIAGAALLNHK